ncbi:MAG: shikimate kinase [Myxococcaceae bacterium]|nr:shikimate kinase [Myxococcaceae bacterium]MCI0671317.1 shikimate kinase [Myxococcaceae bacterium]
MSGPSGERRAALARAVLDALDPRLASEVRALYVAMPPRPSPAADQTVTLVGHRAAGKTRLLPLFAELLGRPGVDLDAHLERVHRRPLAGWVTSDAAGFRAAERAAFASLPAGSLVAVGGGFLSHHADLLTGAYAVLVPVSFQTYCERLRGDVGRPRLRPELTLEEELSQVFHAREEAHARARTVSLAEALRALT